MRARVNDHHLRQYLESNRPTFRCLQLRAYLIEKFHAPSEQAQGARRGSSAGSGASAVRSVLAGAGAGAGAGAAQQHATTVRREISELALPLEADVLATLDQPDSLEAVELEVSRAARSLA